MFFYEKYMVENIYTYLELNAIEIITLKDIKKVFMSFISYYQIWKPI